jgi:ankyrin repeat protein
MKYMLITTITAVLLVGCGESQSPELTTTKATNISIDEAEKPESPTAQPANTEADRTLIESTATGNVEVFKKAIADGANVNMKAVDGGTLLFMAAHEDHMEVAELLIANGADVNAKNDSGETPLDWAKGETANFLRKHGGKTGEELKTKGK